MRKPLGRNKTTAAQALAIENWDHHAFRPAVQYSPRYRELRIQRQGLPVARQRQAILGLYQQSKVMVVCVETGSGKTTQIPQYLLFDEFEAKNMYIVCTQPWRLAAVSVASRVADEMDVEIGDVVGHDVRFNTVVGPLTRLVYMTDGLLLRRAMTKRNFEGIACVIIDEAHERTTNTDILMALLKQAVLERDDLKVVIMSATLDAALFAGYFNVSTILNIEGRTFPVSVYHMEESQGMCHHWRREAHERTTNTDILMALLKQALRERDDLKVVIMSATLNADLFSGYFGGAPILNIEGRTFPVSIYHLEEATVSYLNSALNCAIDIHKKHPPSDILIFLASVEEIELFCQGLGGKVDQLAVLPLYAALWQDEQAESPRAFNYQKMHRRNKHCRNQSDY